LAVVPLLMFCLAIAKSVSVVSFIYNGYYAESES